jgi:hypothetical protein
MKEKFKSIVNRVVDFLIAEHYQGIIRLTNGAGMNANEITEAIQTYDRKLVTLPPEAFDLMDIVEVKNANPKQWSVWIPLWTKEEGRSDLTLQLTITQGDNGFNVEVDDIHVL